MKKTMQIMCVLLCVLIVLSGASCKKADKANESSTNASSTASSGTDSQTASSDAAASGTDASATESEYAELIKTDPTLTVKENPNGWKAVPLVNEEQIKAGLAGGEGGQVILSVATAPTNGKIAFFTTDVGGIYKSIDGGANWFPITDGMRACGGNAIVVDPFNAERVAVVGTNSYVKDKEANGLYITKNGGTLWEIKIMASVGGHRDYRNSIAFDRTSYSASIKGCSTIYWARAGEAYNSRESEPYSALYKSTDGGANWTVVNTSSYIGISDIYVDPHNGYVYASSSGGLYRSTNGGSSFKPIVSGTIGTTCVAGAGDKETKIYYATEKGLFLSTDHGDSFKSVSNLSFLASKPRFLTISPVNENNMVIQDYDASKKELFYSSDGGKNWTKSDMGFSGSRKAINGFITYMEKPRPTAWSATDENSLIAVGGDFMIRSTDGGKSFRWSNSGNNGSCTTRYIINHFNNKLILATNQDYNGGFSVDGGKTWKYVNWQQADWGGQTYGGYIFDENNMVAGVKVNGTNVVAYTFSGGKNVNIMTNKTLITTAAMGSPKNKNVAFLGQYRIEMGSTQVTRDSIKEMNCCVGVYDYDPDNNTLYGRATNKGIVKSTDDGLTWTRIGTMTDVPKHLVYNQKAKKIFILTTDKLFTMNPSNGSMSEVKTIPTKDCNTWESLGFQFKSMAIDHKNPNIMYIGNSRDVYISDTNLIATKDGGKTWFSMCTDEYQDAHGTMPVRSVDSVTVDQVDGAVYTNGGCRGIWRHKGLR